jgi:predicted nucleic acid-binding protein
MLVLDANILISAVLGKRVSVLLKSYSKRISLVTPDSAYREAARNLPAIADRRGVPVEPAIESLENTKEFVVPVKQELYSHFESAARERLRGCDEKDWPVLALALAYGFPIWTQDRDFFGTGVATWKSNLVEIFLREVAAPEDDAPPA